MQFAYPLCEASSVAWGEGGQWVAPNQAWFTDDPFVVAHPDLFSLVPPVVRSTTGRTAERLPLSALPALSEPEPVAAAPAASRVKARANG